MWFWALGEGVSEVNSELIGRESSFSRKDSGSEARRLAAGLRGSWVS